MFKVIIAGSRGFNDYKLLCEVMDTYLNDKMDDIEIVSGTAKGADKLGERYAEDRGYEIKRFRADWKNLTRPGAIIRENSFGKYDCLAGHFRNGLMCEYSNAAVIFNFQNSKGSLDIEEKMRDAKKEVLVSHIKG